MDEGAERRAGPLLVCIYVYVCVCALVRGRVQRCLSRSPWRDASLAARARRPGEGARCQGRESRLVRFGQPIQIAPGGVDGWCHSTGTAAVLLRGAAVER